MFYFIKDKIFFKGVQVARVEPFLSPFIRQEFEDEILLLDEKRGSLEAEIKHLENLKDAYETEVYDSY